jgi:predicted amidohydrolase YtcJ
MEGKKTVRLLIAAMLLLGMGTPSATFARDADQDRCAGSRDILVLNGKIVTEDANDSIVSAVRIKEGRFAAVGERALSERGECTRSIDVHGRTVVPGLIDNHNHFILLSLRPGHDTRLESAFSIADVQAALKARASGLPAGAWITAIGGWIPAQFKENRLPTLSELDAAAPNNPVLVYQQFTGPSAVNTLAKNYFGSLSPAIVASATGQLNGSGQSIQALDALRKIQTLDDQKQGSLDAMAYSAMVGVTTNVDMGGFIIPGLPDVQDFEPFEFDTSASWDPFTAYDAYLALHQEAKITTRLRIFFLSMDQLPNNPLTTQRVMNAFDHFGDDIMRVSGIGEFVTAWPFLFGQNGSSITPNYQNALELVASRGWPFQQHSLSSNEDTFTLQTFQAVSAITPIVDLHWSIAHVPQITQTNISLAKSLGVGIAVHGFEYLSGAQAGVNPVGPPYRTILNSGAIVGAGSDSAQISTLNPWNMLYYMTTGTNVAGNLVNSGQTISRPQALRLYTAANGWFIKEEDKLGSIEVGKLGDLVVLNQDFLDTTRVPDANIRQTRSVLTIVGGRIIYSELF